MGKALVIYVKNSIVESVKEFTGEIDYINQESASYIETLFNEEQVSLVGMAAGDETSCTYQWDNNSISLVWLSEDEQSSDCEGEEELSTYTIKVPFTKYNTYKVHGYIEGTYEAESAEEALDLLQADVDAGEYFEEIEEDSEFYDSDYTDFDWEDYSVE